MRESDRSTAYTAAAAALGTVLLYLASVLPAGKLVVVCVATLCVVLIRSLFGWTWALGCFASTALLSLLLLPSRGAAILYTVLLGYYPIVLLAFQRIGKPVLRWGAKLLLFNAVMAVLFIFVRSLFQGVGGLFSEYPPLLFLAANLAFVIYDRALQQGILYFDRHIARRIR